MNTINTNLLKKFLKITSFNILGMISISVFILADTFFIAQALGHRGLAALNIAISIFSFMNGSALLIGIGAGTQYNIYKTNNQNNKAKSIFALGLRLGFIVSLFFVLLGIFFSSQITTLLGADSEIFNDTHIYIRWLLIGSPAFIFNQIFQGFVRNDHNPRVAMIAMVTSSMLNIVLDYIFIFPLNMGMLGAIIATVFSTTISLILVIFLHFNHRFKDLIDIIKSKVNFKQSLQIIKVGISPFIIEVSVSIVIITFNLMIVEYSGNIGLAAYGIIANIALVIIAVFTGLSNSLQPLSSFYYAKDDTKNLYTVRKYAIVFAIVLSLITYIFLNILSDPIIHAFNSDNSHQLIQITKQGFQIYFIGFFFYGLNVVMATYFNAILKVKTSFIISMLRGLILIVPSAIILSHYLGMLGIWLSFIVSELLTFIYILYKNNKKTFSVIRKS